MDILRVPLILFLFIVIAFAFSNGWPPLAFPAGIGIYYLISSDKGGAGIEGFFALLFGFLVIGGGIILLMRLFL